MNLTAQSTKDKKVVCCVRLSHNSYAIKSRICTSHSKVNAR